MSLLLFSNSYQGNSLSELYFAVTIGHLKFYRIPAMEGSGLEYYRVKSNFHQRNAKITIGRLSCGAGLFGRFVLGDFLRDQYFHYAGTLHFGNDEFQVFVF